MGTVITIPDSSRKICKPKWGNPPGPGYTYRVESEIVVEFGNWTQEYIDGCLGTSGNQTRLYYVSSGDYQGEYARLITRECLPAEFDLTKINTFRALHIVPSTALFYTHTYRFEISRAGPDSPEVDYTGAYNSSADAIISPEFEIGDLTILPTTSMSSSQPTAGPTVTVTPSPEPTAEPTAEPVVGLSPGTKVGIGVGAGLGAVAIGAVAFLYFLRWRRRRKGAAAVPQHDIDYNKAEMSADAQAAYFEKQENEHQEMQGSLTPASEMSGKPVNEMPGSRPMPVELPAR
ncbi:hypothetical protein FQN49_001454 [Arthroderma sp. PD_2]|nr:hypothetical protein FQN49_001454 [Arthroderma sp. PD_2]